MSKKLGHIHAITLIHVSNSGGCILPDEMKYVIDLREAGFVDVDGTLSKSGHDCLREIREFKMAGGLYGEYKWPIENATLGPETLKQLATGNARFTVTKPWAVYIARLNDGFIHYCGEGPTISDALDALEQDILALTGSK